MQLLLCGLPFESVLKHTRVSERCLPLWISRFNSMGVDGIIYRPRSGRLRIVAPDAVRRRSFRSRTTRPSSGSATSRRSNSAEWLFDNRGLDLPYPTLVRYLHEQGSARRIPRPVPEPPDRDLWIAQREDFAAELLSLLEDPPRKPSSATRAASRAIRAPASTG